MSNIDNESKRLASLAVFRELYDSENDIYGVISAFLDEIITSLGKHSFNVNEITHTLNKNYGFAIPRAVVKTSLNRLKYLTKENGIYTASELPKKRDHDIQSLQRDILTSNGLIIDNLFIYIEKELNKKLVESDKQIIVHAFCSFLLNESNGDTYSKDISAFLIHNSNNDEFRKKLNSIREGVVLYTGFSYNDDLSKLGTWTSELTIYLDTEILFHFAGYNGELYRSFFMDFYNYVREINLKAKSRIIRLKYFHSVDNEVFGYFTKAKSIIVGKDTLNPRYTAMRSVLDGCLTPSDVMDKMSDFYLLLKNHNIEKEDFTSYFQDSNHTYNIVDKNTIDIISAEFGYDVTEHLQYLNYIHIHRKELNSSNFNNVGHILLTGTARTLKLAWHDQIKPKGAVPLATTLDWITNKFWFKLNKGFGGTVFPKSFDIITKAQVTLASVLTESVGEKYDKLQKQSKAGELSDDQVKARILRLRSEVKRPEEIEDDEVSSILNSISEDSLDQFILEQEHFRIKADNQAEENVSLKQEIEIKDKKLDKYTSSNHEKITQLKASLGVRISEKEDTIFLINKFKDSIDFEIDKSFRNFKTISIITILAPILLIYYLIWKYSWNSVEPLTWVAGGTFPFLISAIYMLVADKTLNPLELMKNRKEKIRLRKYQQFNYDDEKLGKLKSEILELQKEMTNIQPKVE